ncbi:MAG TPA: FkbM family methyltransferase [Bryobacteraceae bacterium]|nr:FkbM family methyltransferase [Bryobacteraceae bacterium]
MNFSAISNTSVLGRLMRLPLTLVPKTADLPILQGPLRARKWRARSGNHGCWLGSYEYVKQRELAAEVKPGMVCLDVGANVGFYSLLFSTFCGEAGEVVAFEPLPANCDVLRHHIRINRCSKIRVEPMALADFDGEARFRPGIDKFTGRLSPDGTLVVACARLDTLMDRGLVRPPHIVKIDVEGAEMEVIRGAAGTLRSFRPILFLATHGEEVHRGSCALLRGLGYRIRGVGGLDPQQTNELVAQ